MTTEELIERLTKALDDIASRSGMTGTWREMAYAMENRARRALGWEEVRLPASLRADDEARREADPCNGAPDLMAALKASLAPKADPAYECDGPNWQRPWGHDNGPTPDPSAREAAEAWVAGWSGGPVSEGTVRPALLNLFAQPRPVQDAIRDLLSGEAK